MSKILASVSRLGARTGPIVLVLLFVNVTNAQPTPRPSTDLSIFRSFHVSLDRLRQRFDEKSENDLIREILVSLDNINNSVTFIEQVLARHPAVPREYTEGLSQDAELLKRLSQQRGETSADLEMLRDGLKEVDSDLSLKITGPRDSTNAGDIPRVVEVYVRAGNQNVSDYQVWYVVKGWAKDASKFKTFDRPTNAAQTTSMRLAPGNYLIWLRKGDLVTPRQPAEVGRNGETRKDIVVLLP